jgi:hypothetical protein
MKTEIQMGDIENIPDPISNEGHTEIIGPFDDSYHIVTIDGYQVPYLKLHKHGAVWTVVLDDRFLIDGTEEEVAKWVRFMADAMAVSAGLSCFGANCQPINKFKVKVFGLSLDELQAMGNKQ